jgi:long-chain acyl-CoA synthetase
MSVHWPIIRRCLRSPLSTAVVDDFRSWRRVDILVAAMHMAGAIERRCASDTVGIMLPTSGLFPVAALATWMLGKTPVPLNYLLKRDELKFVIDDCGCDTIVTAQKMLDFVGFEPDVANVLRFEDVRFTGVPDLRLPARFDRDDLAVLLYTSGTSGKPKGVMLTHGNLRANIEQSCEHAGFMDCECMLGVLPQFHTFGLTVLTLIPLTIGSKVVYASRFVPTQIVKLMREHKPNVFVGLPSMYNALLRVKSAGPGDFRGLRLAISGGEPLPDDVATRFAERFDVQINEGYGLTETAPVTNVCMPEEHKAHSVGRCVPRLSCRIVDPDSGRLMPPGEEGEIRFQGPNVMRGYFKRAKESAAAFDEHGFFRTGDIGKLDADGHLYITGRLKEMIIVGGENVFPREIEECLNRHETVSAVGVTGVQDPMRGERPVAFVELEEGATFDETALKTWCREHLAGYKAPSEIHAVDELPRTPTGKVQRRHLKALLEHVGAD